MSDGEFDPVMRVVRERASGRLRNIIDRHQLVSVEAVRALGMIGFRKLKNVGHGTLTELIRLSEDVSGERLFSTRNVAAGEAVPDPPVMTSGLTDFTDDQLQRQLERQERAMLRVAGELDAIRAEIDRRRLK